MPMIRFAKGRKGLQVDTQVGPCKGRKFPIVEPDGGWRLPIGPEGGLYRR